MNPTWRRLRLAARRPESGELWRTGELEVFLSGAGLMPGGVAGTWSVDGGEPTCSITTIYQKQALHKEDLMPKRVCAFARDVLDITL